MATIFKWLVRLLVLVAALGAALAGLAYYIAGNSLPDYSASHAARGLQAPLEIVRDSHAVPHIFGASDRDVLFGLGYAHAQDRLWQMLVTRRTAQGRLSEVFGADTLPVDQLMRALDIYGVALAAAEAQRPEVKAELEAYAAGVNAWLDRVRDAALGRGAPELFLFTPQIAPWTPADSIAVTKLMALQLTDKARMEVLRARLSLKLDEDQLADLLPDPPGTVIALPKFADLIPQAATITADAASAAAGYSHPLYPLAPPGFAGASNAWAAGPARTAAGRPLLANDPHLGLSAPSIWYLARLEFASGGAIGGTIPGIPAILVGRNPRLSWGLTSSYLDDQDLYIERLNPSNPGEYETPEGFAPFTTRDTIITVKDAAPVTWRLRWTRHGPVIPAPHFGVADVTPDGHVAALAWTALAPDDRGIGAALALMRAGSVAEARAITADHVAPSLNLMLADADGIAMQTTGRMPQRQDSHQGQGRLPVAGWVAGNDWQGFLPYAANPSAANPDGGILVNTNNRTVAAPFPKHFSFDWGDSQRIVRASRLLNGREFHTLDSFIEAQTDTVAEDARTILPLIARDLWYTGAPAEADTADRRRQIALEQLAAWNGEMSEHLSEPLIYAAWVRALHRRLIADELGPLAGSLTQPDPLFIERVFRDVNGAARWCDIVQSAAAETCTEMARLALDEALIDLSERYGSSMEGWRWRDAHQALHRHPVLGDVPGLGWLFNIRHSTPGGDHTLLRGQSTGREPEPFLNSHAAGFRGVFDMSDPDASVFIIATGQSGHFLSRRYDDLSVLWRRSEYIPMSLDPVAARGGAVGITRLTPAAD